MAFSGALTLTDLNDFITPSQACIKPVEQKDAPRPREKEVGAASTEIMIDSTGAYYEVTSDDAKGNTKLTQAQISLNDCLACSGCITSAESVLITLQSHTEVLNFLTSNAEAPAAERKIPVVSISPQSLASLAASLSSTSCIEKRVTPRQVLRRLKVFCKEVLGFAHVFDTTFARELALREHVKEFVERKKAAEEEGEAGEGQLPMLASACPGWICYAEKAHSEMLPFIAKTKSPQQVMGTLVKSWMGSRWGKKPDGIYHVTVMPCYDKKLEASRKEFYDSIYATRDVDCVITTGELEEMIREKGWDLSGRVAGEVGRREGSEEVPELVAHVGTSSGSYLQSIMEHIEKTWEGRLSVSVKKIRNSDYEEYTITEEREGKVVFKGAKCYGFRNLQNIVRKVGRERGVRTGMGAAGRMRGRAVAGLKKGEMEKKYDYVEVMACPGGCVNGGGQLKGNKEEEGHREEESGGVKWGSKELTRRVEEAYWDDEGWGEEERRRTDSVAAEVLGSLREGALRTEYSAVESEVVGLAVKW